jgi:hypothetical protein
MSRIPEEFSGRLAGFPPELRALLEAELEAGNEIVEVASCFPAPPAGAYVKLARPVATRRRRSGGGIRFVDRASSLYAGEFSDERRFHFILEPPRPPDPEPDMDAIREGRSAPRAAAPVPEGDAVARFARSMEIDYEKWHDGIGYDLDVVSAASAEERARIEELLLARGAADWRDVEALAALGTPGARAVLRRALATGSHDIRMAVLTHAPDVASEEERARVLVAALQHADFFGGLSRALDGAEAHHPPEVIDALLKGTLERAGDVAVHFAALLLFLHGKAPERFDWAQRPFFLRFAGDAREREAAFRELCARIGIDAGRYVAGGP